VPDRCARSRSWVACTTRSSAPREAGGRIFSQHSGRVYWHCQLVRECWLAHVAAETVARATTLAEVEAIGRAAKARIAAWGALTVLVSPLDRAVYAEARRVYKRLVLQRDLVQEESSRWWSRRRRRLRCAQAAA